MTTTYAPVSTRKGFWTRKKIVITGIVAAVAVPSAAYAAVLLFGFGDFASAAATPGTLTVQGNPTTTKTLAPGETVGVQGYVNNPNSYPVKVTDIIVRKSGLNVTTTGDAAGCKVDFAGGTDATYPAEGASAAVANGGRKFPVTSAGTTIAPGDTVLIKADNVIKQDATATEFCGVSAHFAIQGQAGTS